MPQLQRDNTWYFSTGFSRTVGRHTWKTGFQFTHFTMAYLQSLFVRGNYIFNGTYTQDPSNPNTTGDAFADFLLGFPAQTQRSVGSPQAYLRQNTYAAFIQDDWRLTPRISITAGLRYEYAAPFSEDRGNLLNLDYSTLPNPPVLQPVNTVTNPDRLNFAPRIGLAARLPHLFSSSRDTVFRAGYGIYYTPEIANEAYDLVRNGVHNQINEPSGLLPVLTFENGFPQTSSTGFPSYFGIDKNARTPYAQQWSASLQHEAARPGAGGARLHRNKRHRSGAVPALQHARAGRDRRGSAAAPGRSAIAADLPRTRHAVSDPAHRQLDLSFVANQGREAIHPPRFVPRELRLGEVD